MTAAATRRLQVFLSILRDVDLIEESCNRLPSAPVTNNDVDAVLTWMILMLALWLKLRVRMMMMQLANWFAVYIRLSRKWFAPIDRVELLRRTFAR